MTSPGISNQAIPSGNVNVLNPLPVTGIGGAPVEDISFEHAQIHRGQIYTFSVFQATVAGTATFSLGYETGPKLTHIHQIYRQSQDFRLDAYLSGPTWDPDGTLVTPFNTRYDLWGNPLFTCDLRLRFGMSNLVPGALNYQHYIPSGGKGIGNTLGDLAIERVLAANTRYLLNFVNLTNQEAHLNIIGEFYELDL